MRQFVLGLLAAALLFWVYSLWVGRSAEASPDPRAAGGGDAALSQLMGAGSGGTGNDAGATGTNPANAAARPQALDVSAGAEAKLVEEARAALAGGDATKITVVWQALATRTLPANARQTLAKVVAEAVGSWQDGDAARALASLGADNAFLHSAEGRAAGTRAVGLMMAPPDEAALDLGSRFLTLCMHGPIEKAETEARGVVDQAYGEHRKRVDRWLCNPANLTKARTYKVKRGDSLEAIAARFRKEGVRLDHGTLAVLNRIHNPNALQTNQQIKVPVDPVRTLVVKSSYLMAVYVGDALLRLYWVGHGANGKTPEAEFTVLEKIQDPDWYSPQGMIAFGKPENILGRFFVKFQHAAHQGFGAHGTPQPETIGTQASDGCIRMYDADIEDFFKLVPRGSTVTVLGS